ncbi:MAG TPA: DMT family transporter [Candidatus Dormibacteraeota bacterium]
MSRRGWFLFLIVGVVWGFPYLLIKVSVSGFSPLTVVFIRTAIGALLLVPLVTWRGELWPVLRRWPTLVVFTVIEIAGPWLLLSDAERHLSSSLSGLLVAAVPLVGALLAWLTGADERVEPRRLLGMVVGLAGVAVLVGFDVGRSDLFAAGEIALVTIGYAVGPLIIARKMGGLSGTGVVAAALTLTALVYAGPAAAQLTHVSSPGSAIAAVMVLGVLCTAFAFPVFFALIREVGPVRATVVTYINPTVAVLAGVVLLGEPFGASTAVGFALVIAGSFLATRRRAPASEASAALEAETATEAAATGAISS